MMVGIIIAYVAIAIMWYPYEFAFWQREFPTIANIEYTGNRLLSIILAAVWPISFVAKLLDNDFPFRHGRKWE
jgi:hypothetical protein